MIGAESDGHGGLTRAALAEACALAPKVGAGGGRLDAIELGPFVAIAKSGAYEDKLDAFAEIGRRIDRHIRGERLAGHAIEWAEWEPVDTLFGSVRRRVRRGGVAARFGEAEFAAEDDRGRFRRCPVESAHLSGWMGDVEAVPFERVVDAQPGRTAGQILDNLLRGA